MMYFIVDTAEKQILNKNLLFSAVLGNIVLRNKLVLITSFL